MGAIPNRLPGFQEILDDGIRAKFEAAWGSSIPAEHGLHLTGMFEAMEHGELRAVYVVGENPAQGEADQQRAERLLTGLEHLVVQDLFLTRTAELADVVLPAAATLGEVEGTVTSSERRVQRVRKAYDAPADARDDIEIVYELARRMGHDLGSPRAEDVWNECRSLSPMHAGMSYARLEAAGGIQWPCLDEDDPGALFLHGRLWDDVVEDRAPFMAVEHDPPVDVLDDDFPLRLTTGRRLESYNTGVQTNRFSSPLHVGGEAILLAPEDGERYGVADGARRAGRLAARLGRSAGALRHDAAPRARVHEPPFPRRGGDEHAHDRRDRSAVGHRGVQGDGDPAGGRVGGSEAARRRADRRRARGDRRRCRCRGGEREPCRAARPHAAPSTSAGSSRGAAARGLGHAGRARLHLAPPRRAAGRRVRGRDLLRAARARRASR